MKHAKPEDLVSISSLLEKVRSIEGIRERTPAHFYFRGVNVLHFHTDRDEIYCDVGTERLKAQSDSFEIIISSVMELIKNIKETKVGK
jgi:hypothetical protein